MVPPAGCDAGGCGRQRRPHSSLLDRRAHGLGRRPLRATRSGSRSSRRPLPPERSTAMRARRGSSTSVGGSGRSLGRSGSAWCARSSTTAEAVSSGARPMARPTRRGCSKQRCHPDRRGSRLVMHLHYGGSLWGPVLEHMLGDEIENSRPPPRLPRQLTRLASRGVLETTPPAAGSAGEGAGAPAVVALVEAERDAEALRERRRGERLVDRAARDRLALDAGAARG